MDGGPYWHQEQGHSLTRQTRSPSINDDLKGLESSSEVKPDPRTSTAPHQRRRSQNCTFMRTVFSIQGTEGHVVL